MELAALVSGGKDSMLSLYRMHLEGHKIKYLLTMDPESHESYMFHHQNIWVTELISKSTGIPIVNGRTHGRKEEELHDLSALFEIVSDDVEGVISGAMASTYQKNRIDSLCKKLSLNSFAPLWQIDPEEMWEELFLEDFRVMITGVAAAGFNERWLGRIIDRAAFQELIKISEKYRFHLGFEGGEAETLVLNMPLYQKKIEVKAGEVSWDGRSGNYLIKEAVLEGIGDELH
jgi:ABC transporter with metal-binding/Fe-S-binding domain ATP-binding protein